MRLSHHLLTDTDKQPPTPFPYRLEHDFREILGQDTPLQVVECHEGSFHPRHNQRAAIPSPVLYNEAQVGQGRADVFLGLDSPFALLWTIRTQTGPAQKGWRSVWLWACLESFGRCTCGL